MFQAYLEDSEHGGLYHAASEDWSEIVDTNKHAREQFIAARSSVIGAMITHESRAIADAEAAVTGVMGRFEDTANGGFFFMADREWHIAKKEKSLEQTGDIFGVLMHLYEVSKKDDYLLRALDFLDVALDRAWDREHGGFFALYARDWKPAVDIKDLETQCCMLRHMNGSWKDGMDSPWGARAAGHRKRAEDFGALLLEKAEDRRNGGFYTAFTRDWRPAETVKETAPVASLALTLYFHYHNMGPSIWGPRKGSHAYTGRPYPAAYRYLGPAPSPGPVGTAAFRFGKKVIEIADLLLERAWDADCGGFYTSLSESLEPENTLKLISTQIACIMALNVAYRLSGFKRFRQKLAEETRLIEEKCFDSENSGTYASFERNWQPLLREKICGPNLMIGGILSMAAPVAAGVEVARCPLRIWVDPPSREISRNGTARFTVTVQNQGFDTARVRVGGLSSPSRWMDPADTVLELRPHETVSYGLAITPPDGMPAGTCPFEITCMYEGEVGEYVSACGTLRLV